MSVVASALQPPGGNQVDGLPPALHVNSPPSQPKGKHEGDRNQGAVSDVWVLDDRRHSHSRDRQPSGAA